jgi:hypothetical protein
MLALSACGGDDFSASKSGGAGGSVTGGSGGSTTGGSGGSVTGGSGGGTSNAGAGGEITLGGSSAWEGRCQDVVDHNAACGKGSADAAAVTDCVATDNCVPSVWSAAVVDTTMTCLVNLACTSPDDDCISATVVVQTATKQALFTACEQKATECTGFSCLETTFLVSDSLATSLHACLSQACDAASACIQSEYASAVSDSGCLAELPFGG